MCRKKKVNCNFIKLVTIFLLIIIQCEKNRSFVHGEAFEVKHEIYRFLT